MCDHDRLASLRRTHRTSIPSLTLVCTVVNSDRAHVGKWLQLRHGIARSRLLRVFGMRCCIYSLAWEYARLIHRGMSNLQPVETLVEIVLPAKASSVSRG
jgi:hypothetical protein